MTAVKKQVTAQQTENLLSILKARFEKNVKRHPNVDWETVLERLEKQPEKLWSLQQMEETEGEPDVVTLNENEITFVDCAAESPKGRRSVCYDHAALEARKLHKPANSALQMALEMGITILNEAQYKKLQEQGEFDLKTSSWIQTPDAIRTHGGALFCDRRYKHVFTYHNGADSYYGARGFRAYLIL